MTRTAAIEEKDFCNRCGCCSLTWESCYDCGGDGFNEDYYDGCDCPCLLNPELAACDTCGSKGGWQLCVGSCDSNGKHQAAAIEAGGGQEKP